MASYTNFGPANHAGLFTRTPSAPSGPKRQAGRVRQVSDCVTSVDQAGAPLLSASHTLQNGVATDSDVDKPCHEYASFQICISAKSTNCTGEHKVHLGEQPQPPRAPAHYTPHAPQAHRSPD